MPAFRHGLGSASWLVVAGLCLGFTGCAHPNADNIRLRKLNQDLQARVTALTGEHEGDQRTIEGLRKRSPVIPTLPPEELKNLWVTAGIDFGRMTGGEKVDPTKNHADALRVYVSPTSESGQSIQAAGSFVVEAFDLAEPGDNRLGRWTWDPIATKAQWRAFLIEFGYELTCPWQKLPKHPDITIRVTFTDEITHVPFTNEKRVHVDIPPPVPETAPTTSASH